MAEYKEDLIQFDTPPRFRDIKLPSFWSDKPSSWFALAESCFRTRTHGITGEQAKFDQLVGALNKESIGRVLDLIEVPPLFTPYAQLKARLLDAHQLTNYQKVDQLLKMGDLGARRPSELLAAILELCPRGQETSLFFTHLFQRPFSHMHVDLVGPLPVSSDGFIHILTMIDRTTRWLEAVPLKEMTASTCSAAFIASWVARFGVPASLTLVRGTQFSSTTCSSCVHVWASGTS